MASTILYRVVWVPSTLGLCGALVAFASNPVAIPKPAENMATYETSDKSITVSHPSNWHPRQLSANATQTEVEFVPARGVYFDIKGDLQGSLMADISKSTGGGSIGLDIGGGDLPSMGGGSANTEELGKALEGGRRSPVEGLHANGMESLKETLKDFSEGDTKKLQIANMEAVSSDFTFKLKNVFSSTDAVGRRITMLNGERRFIIYYYCPKSAQSTIEPVFEKMVKSVKIGTVGG
jgi:hypothetical protein